MANNRSTLEKITRDVASEISTHLSNKDIKNTALANKQLYSLFKPDLEKRIDEKIIEHAAHHRHKEVEKILSSRPSLLTDKRLMHKLLFHHVAFGQQDEAEKILQHWPALLFMNGIVTDYSNRTFENSNPIRYAIWAKDTLMLAMLLYYLAPLNGGLAYAKQQFAEHEKHGVSYIQERKGQKIIIKIKVLNEQHFDFSQLIAALNNCVKQYPSWNFNEHTEYWCKRVGYAQQELVAHAAQHYCDPKESFDPTPSFKKTTFKRCLRFYDCDRRKDEVWFPRVDAAFGKDFAIVRRHADSAEVRRPWVDDHIDWFSEDLSAISELCKVRTEDLSAFKHYLNDPTSYPLPNHLKHKLALAPTTVQSIWSLLTEGVQTVLYNITLK